MLSSSKISSSWCSTCSATFLLPLLLLHKPCHCPSSTRLHTWTPDKEAFHLVFTLLILLLATSPIQWTFSHSLLLFQFSPQQATIEVPPGIEEQSEHWDGLRRCVISHCSRLNSAKYIVRSAASYLPCKEGLCFWVGNCSRPTNCAKCLFLPCVGTLF